MNTIIEKIRAWVEREKEKQMDIWRDSTSEDALGMALDKISVYNQFLSFLSDLEKEDKPSEGLEEEAVSYCFDNGLNLSPRVATDFARHFYEFGLNARKEE